MDNYYLKINNSIYTEMRALIWVGNGLSFPNLVEYDAVKLLAKIVTEFSETQKVYINFKGISQIDDHALEIFANSINDNLQSIIIYNISNILLENPDNNIIQLLNYEKKLKYYSGDDYIIIGEYFAFNKETYEASVKTNMNILMNDILFESFLPYNKFIRLKSTPVLANGEFDARKIVSNDKYFLWTTLLMTDKISEIIENTPVEKTKLLSSNLRSSPFITSIAQYLDKDFDFVDHLGPNFNLIEEEISNSLTSNVTRYIYIGDFTIGGTEIKLAQLFCQLSKCKLNDAVVIGSALEEKDYSSFVNLKTLKNLQEIGNTVEYKF